jgi:hypothetical protein
VNEGAKGPPIYDVVSRHIEKHKNINMEANRAVKIKGA